jgi:hypothetical protein
MNFMNYIVFLTNVYVAFSINYCKNCKHYKIDSLFDRRPALCLKFPIENNQVDVVSGNKIEIFDDNHNPIDGLDYEYCSVARSLSNKCGISGRKYIEKYYYSVEKHDGIQMNPL